jgi:hypothetical protein
MYKEWWADAPWDKVSQENARQQLEEKTRDNLKQLKDAFGWQDVSKIEWNLSKLNAEELKKINDQISKAKFEDTRIQAEWNKNIMSALQWKWESAADALDNLNFV